MTLAGHRQAPMWIRMLEADRLDFELDESTVKRGQAYQYQGRVQRFTVGRDDTVVIAHVMGSRGRTYTSTVRLDWPTRAEAVAFVDDPGEIEWSSNCTCPMGQDCKHVVATLLEVQEDGRLTAAAGPDLRTEPPRWESAFDALVRPPAANPAANDRPPLGLLFDVAPSRSRPGQPPSSPHLTLRPVAPGANGNWVRSGIGWHDLDYGRRAQQSRAEHRAAIRAFALWTRSQGAAANAGYYSGSFSPTQTLNADGLGPGLWRLIDDAIAVGVPLLTGSKGQHPVRIVTEPVTADLDLSRTADGGLRVTAGVRMPGDGGPLHLIGSPAHGAFTQSGGELVLARFAVPLEPALAQLLERPGDVVVPTADVGRFLTHYYPALRLRARVVSNDGSVELPEVAPPRLALHITAEDSHRLTLQWSFRYRVGDDPVDVPLLGAPGVERTSGLTPPRDPVAEEALLASLDVLDAVTGLRVSKHGLARLAVVVEPHLSGMATVVFVRDVLPALQQRDDIDVTVVGDLLAYSETAEPPLISVSAHEPNTGSAPDAPQAGADRSDSTLPYAVQPHGVVDQSQPDWFDLGITVTVAGHPVPLSRLLAALAANDEHLILDNGTWFSLDLPSLQALRRIVEEARALDDRPGQGLRLNRFHAGLWGELVELGVVAHQSDRWSRTVGALLGLEELPRPDVPAGVQAELRHYQLEGYQWLSLLWDHELGGILADDMGLGKTLQTLTMAERARTMGTLTPDAPLLVVAPTSVVSAWLTEAARFTPGLRVVAVTETVRRSGIPLPEATSGAHVVVTSYALFRIDEDAYRGLRWAGLVLDEAQFVKNHQARTYAAARRLPAPFKLAITGTPLENSLMDLWSLLSIVAPGLFPSPQRFGELFRKPIESGAEPELLDTLRRRIRPLMLRRTKEAVAPDLPPKIEQVVAVALNPAHRRIYDRHLARERQRILGLLGDVDRNRIAILSALTKLRQLSLDVHLVEPDAPATVRSSKVDALLDQLVEVAAEGHRCLVFSQFTGFLAVVRKRLADEGIEHVYLDGRTRDRPKRIAAFTEGAAPVFVISLKAGGSGLTLTEADYVFVLDPWWNPAVEAQAIDRAHRIGQDKTVMVYRLVSEGTIEEKVLALQERKRELFAKVVDDGGLMSAPLTPDDIRGLLGS